MPFMSRQTRINLEMRPDKLVAIESDYKMNVGDTDLLVSPNERDVKISLPPVGEAKGIPYLVKFGEGDSRAVISDLNDTTEGLDDIILNSPGQSVELISDGEVWTKTDLFVPKKYNRNIQVESIEANKDENFSFETEKVRAEKERLARLEREKIALENQNETKPITTTATPRKN